MAPVLCEDAVLEDCGSCEDDFVSTRLPASIESLNIIISYYAFCHQEPMCTADTKTQLTIILKEAVANCNSLACEFGPAGIRVFERAIFNLVVIS